MFGKVFGEWPYYSKLMLMNLVQTEKCRQILCYIFHLAFITEDGEKKVMKVDLVICIIKSFENL